MGERLMGFDRCDRILRGDTVRWPRLYLRMGDRARFWSLSTGRDDKILASKFHRVESLTSSIPREVVCVRSMTEGEEVCALCEEGHADTGTRFALWVWVDCILHLGDNPDVEGEPWKQVKVGNRIMFKEDIRRPLLLRLGVGRQYRWYGQFRQVCDQYGSLAGKLFELRRIGSGRDDTDYVLAIVKEAEPPPEAKAALKELPAMEEVFRSSLGGAAPRPTLTEGHREAGGIELGGADDLEEADEVQIGPPPDEDIEELEEAPEML